MAVSLSLHSLSDSLPHLSSTRLPSQLPLPPNATCRALRRHPPLPLTLSPLSDATLPLLLRLSLPVPLPEPSSFHPPSTQPSLSLLHAILHPLQSRPLSSTFSLRILLCIPPSLSPSMRPSTLSMPPSL
eukprot:1910741-Rhodomonas_salina.1